VDTLYKQDEDMTSQEDNHIWIPKPASFRNVPRKQTQPSQRKAVRRGVHRRNHGTAHMR